MGPTPSSPASLPSWLAGLPPRTANVWDEVRAPDGSIRPHWHTYVQALGALGREEMARRWQSALHVMHENGITYNVYGDPGGLERPWQLDPLPLILPAGEWDELEAALIQRATLLNAILVDLNGPGRLLANGVLPPAVVYGYPMFLRPCHGVPVKDNTYLHLYAVDLARSPDGRWWVLNDRTQAPSGFGYSLENRIVMSRAMPELFHECRVARLSSFSSALKDAIRAMAPRPKDNPRIVLLTPGPYNETYFEHSYLARFLGCTLVEGEDLTVRDNAVFLKTLSGLKPVDVVLRRLDEDFCDPLVLRSDSSLGVAGLLGAVAAGNVTVANALGSGLVENPALRAFLGPLCQRLLGEPLRSSSVATWWCGQPEPMRHVLGNLHRLVVRPVFGDRTNPLFGAPAPDRAAADALSARIRAKPYAYVAHESFDFSAIPVLRQDGRLEPRATVLRVFLIAHNGTYLAMPGGLTRVAKASQTVTDASMTMQAGAGSKDTWIIRDVLEEKEPLLAHTITQIPELRRGKSDLASRVADNLFWLGRYTERFEGIVRMFRTILMRMADEPTHPTVPGLRRLIRVPASLGYLPEPPAAPASPHRDWFARIEREMIAAIFEPRRPGGLRDTLTCLHRLAGSTRDRMSPDVWRILNQLHEEVDQPGRDHEVQLGEALALLNQMLLALAAFAGIEMENMTRALDWRFLNMGRRLERAVQTIRVLHEMLVWAEPDESAVLEILLELHDSSITYRSRYFSAPHPVGILDLLLLDESNPRSVGFQVSAIAGHLEHLPRDQDGTLLSQERKILLSAQSQIRLADAHQLAAADGAGHRAPLERTLAQLTATLPEFSDALTLNYFTHAPARSETPDPGV